MEKRNIFQYARRQMVEAATTHINYIQYNIKREYKVIKTSHVKRDGRQQQYFTSRIFIEQIKARKCKISSAETKTFDSRAAARICWEKRAYFNTMKMAFYFFRSTASNSPHKT